MRQGHAANAASGAMRTTASKAEAALLRVQEELQECLGQDIRRLRHVRNALGGDPSSEEVGQLYMHAHHLKGLGVTCGYPIVTAVAAQLCQIIDDDGYEFSEQVGLIDDHIDALAEAFDKKIRTQEHPMGRKLLADLRRDLEYR